MSKTQLSTATRTLPSQVQKSVVDAFESPDVINLPEGNTAWRASNAISWVARQTKDAELRLDLERAAGALDWELSPAGGRSGSPAAAAAGGSTQMGLSHMGAILAPRGVSIIPT
jgi:hypothetical protein